MSNTSDINQLSPLQRSVLALKEMRAKLDAVENAKTEPIAIIGMNCRFPGEADYPEKFWELLHNGIDAITEVPADRWDVDEYYNANPNTLGKIYTRYGGFIKQVDQFDPHFFGLSPLEAASMDPQHRLLLEVGWEAIENAGQSPEELNGSQTGVFMGLFMEDYSRFNLYSGDHHRIDAYSSLGNARSIAIGRLAYVLGLQGPVMQLDTACSSSLLAVHLACQSLRSGECNMALAGGVNLILAPEASIGLSRMRALAPDGRCKTFDAKADGYVRGEGCGIVVLKRLSDAIANNDNILAVVRGSAVNHDGASSGLTVPNGLAQEKLINQALKNAKVAPEQISYVETHGTGTSLGDPIEVRALGSVLCQGRSPEQPLLIGSVKTQLGHLESAAGVASLMKVVLALQHAEIPPHLHLQQPSPHIPWDKLSVAVPTVPTQWPKSTQKRLAGVSSFGMSGTNAHLIIEEAPEIKLEPQKTERPLHLLSLSAKTEAALLALASRYESFLTSHLEASLADICFTANTGRSHFEHRLAVVAASNADLQEQLTAFSSQKNTSKLISGQVQNKRSKVVFMFTGQGSQYVEMGRQLYETQPTFRKTLDRCDEILRPYLEQPLLSVLFPTSDVASPLNETAYTQPALFALEYSLAELWKSWGIVPDAVMGHSVGEYVAACVAGVFSLEDGLKLIAERGRLIQSLPQNGMMAAVFTNEARINDILAPYAGQVAIAGINGPENIVISGAREAVQAVLKELASQGINAQPLQVSHAFHSPLMASILEPFEQIASSVQFQAPRIPLISNLNGQILKYQEIPNATYWRQHLREGVRFYAGIKTLHEQGYEIFVEMGPSSTLVGMGKRCLPEGTGTWLTSLKKGQPDWTQLLSSLSELYVRGIKINWTAFDQDYQRHRIALPTYPFQRQRYWVENTSPVKSEQVQIQKPVISQVNTLPKIPLSVPPNWFHSWQWSSEVSSQSQDIPSGAILIFSDRHQVGENLERLFDSKNYTTYFVTPGESFNQTGRNFTINPASVEDYEQLIKNIKADGVTVTAAVHLWNYSLWAAPPEQLLENDRLLNERVYSLLFLAQALVKHYPVSPFNFLVVTQGAYSISPNDSLQCVHQSMAGVLAQVVAQENPTIKTKVVDFNQDVYLPEKLADILFQEMKAASTGEGIVAIRDGQRLSRTLEKINVPTDNDSLPLLPGETWLITGGTSAVGTEIALALVRQVPINLVLTGRHPLPSRQEWQSPSHDSQTQQRIQAIQQLEQLKATVMYQAVDVTDALGMKQLIENIKSRFGNLHGVIHAAGAVDHSTFKLLQKQPAAVAKVLAPKVQGTIILDAVTRNEPLKYFVLLSSVSASKAEWGTGMGDYAAANTFLDSYAVYRTQQGGQGRSLALNYSLWSDRGMGALLGASTLLMVKSKGLNPLEPEPAANAFIKALSLDTSAVIHIIDLIAQVTPEVAPKSATSPQQTKSRNLRQLVREVLLQHLRIPEEQVEGHKTFQEMGLDSVGTVEVVQHLGTAIGEELFPTLLFEYQTPDDLVDYLQSKYGYSVKNIPTPEETSSLEAEKLVTPNVETEEKYPDVPEQDIAIIGMACKIPGADNLEQYWDLLDAGRSVIQDVPDDRWFNQHYFEAKGNAPQPKISKRGCFVDRPFDFDPMFFGISPKEATAMDPQQRLFLELSMQALQQAGYGGKYRPDNIGVFVGCGQNTYIEHFTNYQYYEELHQRLQESPWFDHLTSQDRQHLLKTLSQVLQPSEILPESAAGNEVNELAARVSHCLNLKGPSMAVSTACSSSLVALHIACESLRSGQTGMAIVGGVNLNLSPSPFTFLRKAQALSLSGTCYPFDRRANGIVLGEGAGVLIIKPLKQALADGDLIHAVIKGSAVNNDGHSQGITAPNPKGQAEAVRQAYKSCGVDPRTISYIETHGTGTLLGDPVEVEGMTQAFRSFTDERGFCTIGSVKSSIGHLLSASGIVSLIKVVLAMQHGKIPQTVGFEQPNPHINFADTPFSVAGKSIPWSQNENPLRAGVNGFGFGGTNCHVILEESPATANLPTEVKSSAPNLLVLTARNQQALQEVARQLHEHIINHPEQESSQICFTQNNAQRELPYKAALVVNDRQHLLNQLEVICLGQTLTDIYTGRANPQRTTPFHLVLDGTSAIAPAEVETLGKRFPQFQAAYNSVRAVCNEMSEQAHIFAVQYAWGRLLMSLELQPTNLLVEKIGILAGATLRGMLTLEQAIALMLQIEGQKGFISNDVFAKEQLPSTWTCSLVTSQGIFRYSDTISAAQLVALVQVSEQLNADACQDVISKESVYLHLGYSFALKEQLASLDELGVWIYLDKQQPVVERLLTSLAKTYVAGVRFNSIPLFPQGLRRVLLPTYPFERKTYRVSLVDSSQENQEPSIPAPKLLPLPPDSQHHSDVKVLDTHPVAVAQRLLPVEKLPLLTDSQRQLSYAKLTQDLKVFDNSQEPSHPVAVAQRLLPVEKLPLLTDSQRHLSYTKLTQDLKIFDNSHEPKHPVAVAQRLLPVAKLPLLTDSQRQLSYAKLTQDLEKFGK
ncbi:SDR family NAD(P)-dependent oxidoreductase [Nostocaceae cyanobacterium CENA357]|uniref:SDR family NAD(P)-dependent oxidoreductase n=1 Tax=Atlanticothrix silvestris CENA357 TaxID=1725252 RepID=A0A8J7HIQ9_9CYAN|nr:type I polyketide synthase [Atlanticothrix silvestris]MBH8553203.1 SDR family NAD(P)-dependent oxidoreductase [Atlanticothrix silvestris CENA357]